MNNIPRKFVFKILGTLLALLILTLSQASVLSSDAYYRVCFTPGQQCTSLIVNTIENAKASIYVQAYSFTAQKIADALVEAKMRGVKVFVILDKSQLKERHSQMSTLYDAKIPIWIDNKVAIAHNKVMIIDGKTVITGSFNFTNSAQKRNAENLLIIDNGDLAAKYFSNWQQRQNKSYRYS